MANIMRLRSPNSREVSQARSNEHGETKTLLRSQQGRYILEEVTPKGRVRRKTTGYFIPAKLHDTTRMQEFLAEAANIARSKGLTSMLDVIYQTGKTVRSRTSSRPAPAEPVVVEDFREREARQWKEMRETFLADHRSLTAPELAELTGSKSRNPSSRAHEWLRAGKIFSVYDGSIARYPLFQIDPHENKPRPEIRETIAFLREQLSDWQMAIWFTTPNGWTGEWRRPVDLLGIDAKRVIDAAQQEVAEEVL